MGVGRETGVEENEIVSCGSGPVWEKDKQIYLLTLDLPRKTIT